MKRIELTKLSLLNFKGARNVENNFHGNTTIAADNGVGKSTLFDAFVWLLFGKNAEDRKDFSIKTYDTNGEIIPRIPHEVSAVINVNGENISLRRCFNEKWTKRRGSATEEFTGHEEERFWNDVPCNLKDWNSKIAEIIPEQTFKMITNHRYFVAQKADVQRATLMKMAGEIKEQDIIAGDADFIQLTMDLQGKTIEEYKRQIAAKKSIVKGEIKGIPERIDERKRDVAETMNEADANNKMAALKARQENIEEMLTFRNKAIDEINARREQANKKINAIQAAINERERQIIIEANKELHKAQKSAMEIQNAIDKGVTSVERAKFDLELNQKEKASFEQQIAELRKEYLAERMKKIEFNENDFVCPTCKRPFDVSDVELKQREMTENFNQQKVLRLNNITEKGVELKTRIKEREMSIKANLDSIKFGEEAIAKLRAKQKSVVPQSESNADVYMNVDAMLKQLKEQMERAKEEFNKIPNTANDEELEAKKKMLHDVLDEIDQVKSELAKIKRNKEIEKRCEELADELRRNNEELARLEGVEYTIARYQKRKVEMVEGKINGMFKQVTWKMYEQQINGGEVECCIPLVNGVPFADANKTGQLHAGLDIISTICNAESVTAPIFIDNAESYNTIPNVESQVICLVVSKDKQLTIL